MFGIVVLIWVIAGVRKNKKSWCRRGVRILTGKEKDDADITYHGIGRDSQQARTSDLDVRAK